MKMFTCDYKDLVHPQAKKQEEANKFIGSVVLEGVECRYQPSRSRKCMPRARSPRYRSGSRIIGRCSGPKEQRPN